MPTQANQTVVDIEKNINRIFNVSNKAFWGIAILCTLGVFIFNILSGRGSFLELISSMLFVFLASLFALVIPYFVILFIVVVSYIIPKAELGASLLAEQAVKLASPSHIVHSHGGAPKKKVEMTAMAIDIAEKKVILIGHSSRFVPLIIPKADIINTVVNEDAVIHTATSGSAVTVGHMTHGSASFTSRKVSKFYLHIRYKNAQGSVSTFVVPFDDNANKASEFKSTIDIL